MYCCIQPNNRLSGGRRQTVTTSLKNQHGCKSTKRCVKSNLHHFQGWWTHFTDGSREKKVKILQCILFPLIHVYIIYDQMFAVICNIVCYIEYRTAVMASSGFCFEKKFHLELSWQRRQHTSIFGRSLQVNWLVVAVCTQRFNVCKMKASTPIWQYFVFKEGVNGEPKI